LREDDGDGVETGDAWNGGDVDGLTSPPVETEDDVDEDVEMPVHLGADDVPMGTSDAHMSTAPAAVGAASAGVVNFDADAAVAAADEGGEYAGYGVDDDDDAAYK
jgi:hypothetical protein